MVAGHLGRDRPVGKAPDLAPPARTIPDARPIARAVSPATKYRLLAELGHGGMADLYLAVAQGLAGFCKLVVV
jgi:hypothetical protein